MTSNTSPHKDLGAPPAAVAPYPSRRFGWNYARLLIVSVILQLVLFALSSALAYHSNASFLYAPAGLSVALFLLLGGRALPIVLCCVAATTLVNEPILEPGADPVLAILLLLGIPLAHAVPYWAGVSVLQRTTPGEFDPRNPTQVLRFLIIIPIAAAVAAFLGVIVLYLLGGMPFAQAQDLFAAWWIGDTVAAVCLSIAIAYLSLMMLEWIGADLGCRFVCEDNVHSKHLPLRDLLYLPLAWLLFFASASLAYNYPEKLGLSFPVYAMVIALLWTIYKARSPIVYVVLAVLTVTLAYTASAFGLIASAAEYQIAMIAVGSITYFTHAAVSSQRKALDHSEQVNMRLLSEIRQKEFLQEKAELLQFRSGRDYLTGALNRAFFQEALHTQYHRRVQRGNRHCLAFVDLNDFKQVNDRFGHHAGDEALKAVARILMSRSRKGDIVARYSGDLFVVILPEVAYAHEADAIITRWKQDVANQRIQTYPKLTLSISVGRAFFPGSSENETEMSILRAADQDMDQDKAQMKTSK
ncbi:diguanylate cyclase [Lamprobacter modestohalophilus]|uniref:GGDEF domain-containing protein n=1 Tax=Lamprobacter modestohalophilus TaxID=1064514 RepID=UPI002ADEEA9A|nr:diguanylate cyclase [Lamprobacter modestohalophilus]MEA1048831.1 diguanylate cyclase [Lamprobacter modestohalophilus]